jgi:hypothetical protein
MGNLRPVIVVIDGLRIRSPAEKLELLRILWCNRDRHFMPMPAILSGLPGREVEGKLKKRLDLSP